MSLAKLRSAIVSAQKSIDDAQHENNASPSLGVHPDNAFVDLVDAVQCLLHGCEYLVEIIEKQQARAAQESAPIYGTPSIPPGPTLAAIEAAAIRDCLERNKGNRRSTATELGIARSSLQRKIDELGLREKPKDEEAVQ